uniref:Zgc:109744 n=1 Tax=Fundulus heteroclitus TaxID=8078 RepID=A0A3Q2QVB2_FUNHE
MEEGQDFSLHAKPVVNDANLRDEYYWKLVADFIGPQSGEGLELNQGPCKNRLMIQVGLLREDNNFPWLAITEWLKKIFPAHQSADFRCLIERGIATTLSLGTEARLTFLDSDVNFNFVGPICDSIGVERQHLLELRDFSERARSIEVTNGLILEFTNFVAREKISPVVIVTWLKNFNPDYCKHGDIQKAYKLLRARIKKLKICCRNYETRSHRRNAAIEKVLQSPFELVRRKSPKLFAKKRMRRDDYERVIIKEEEEWSEISQSRPPEVQQEVLGHPVQTGSASRGGEEDQNASSHQESSADRGESLTLLDIAMLSVQKLSSVYGGKTETCKGVSLDLLKNHYALTYKEHPAMEDFENKVSAAWRESSLVPPVVFLNYNANFLVGLHDAVEAQIMSFEKEIILSTGVKLGRDNLSKFKNFVNLPESATSRYIHMACDILSPISAEKPNYRKHWVAFCEEKGNPSRLAVNQSNRLNNYFEAAAGLIHHHKETALFFADLLSIANDPCPNVILESVAADANDSMIQCFVCVVAIVYCKVLGPYWQLLKSGGEYALFSRFLLCLYQRFIDWSKDPSTLLEPEDGNNVFLQFPLQERVFSGVFRFCGDWHTNRDLIRACLKRTVKVIAAVTEEHLKEFLPGGRFSQTPSSDLCLQMVSCTFSVLMAEYPFGHAYPYKKKRPDQQAKGSSKGALESSQEDEGMSGNSSDEASRGRTFSRVGQNELSPQTRRAPKRAQEEEQEENMDKDYITAVVTKNGGPCKTQQDLDKMMLRFDGKSRSERREAVRCEMLYQKLVLNNADQNLDYHTLNTTQMVMKLKLALPRVKPGYSLVLAPRKTKPKPLVQNAAADPDAEDAAEPPLASREESPDCCSVDVGMEK